MKRTGVTKIPYTADDFDSEHCLCVDWEANEHVLSFVVEEHYEERGEQKKQPRFRGHLKWDGCLNIRAVNGDDYMHFCGPEKEPLLGRMMVTLYELGNKIPNWDFNP